MDFNNEEGDLAEESNHHPDIQLSYGRVIVQLETHEGARLTNEEERWDMVLSNVNNFLAEEGDTKISIVANGHAVNYYLNDELSDKILNQVDVVACQNSLNNNKINKDQINPLIRVVDSGVV